MKLSELAAEYRQSAALLKERINQLKHMPIDGLGCMKVMRLRGRIKTLEQMYRQTSETAVKLERYYGNKKEK